MVRKRTVTTRRTGGDRERTESHSSDDSELRRDCKPEVSDSDCDSDGELIEFGARALQQMKDCLRGYSDNGNIQDCSGGFFVDKNPTTQSTSSPATTIGTFGELPEQEVKSEKSQGGHVQERKRRKRNRRKRERYGIIHTNVLFINIQWSARELLRLSRIK